MRKLKIEKTKDCPSVSRYLQELEKASQMGEDELLHDWRKWYAKVYLI